jgi:hypothetical protein
MTSGFLQQLNSWMYFVIVWVFFPQQFEQLCMRITKQHVTEMLLKDLLHKDSNLVTKVKTE